MSNMQTQTQAAQPENAVKVVNSPVDLKSKCLRPGNPSTAALQAIANAEQAMDELSVNFTDWMSDESIRLAKARDEAKSAGFVLASREELFHASHDIKGQASTLGYPFAAEVCGSLCRLLEMVTEAKRIPPLLVDQHVDAVRAFVREDVTGRENPVASKLLERLCSVTDAYISDEAARVSPAKTA